MFDAGSGRPGRHVVNMGPDVPGKHELPTGLYPRARLFCDRLSQSVQIGDFQHARQQIDAGTLKVIQIGGVIKERAPGRCRADTPGRGHGRCQLPRPMCGPPAQH
ncbi:hypothetical protein [Pannonibacter indicus]|uniref:hypothetical protein n=1 Tax=Pannonibacter indicus TaxID=466044 RepID=UPI001FCAC017|nr:hypothetical protein [Pannonibacter indicus]